MINIRRTAVTSDRGRGGRTRWRRARRCHQHPHADRNGAPPNGHDRQPQTPLASDVAAKIKAAALAKVPGATVLRSESGTC